ncbi:MAG: 3-oxoacyl-(acyl-carrier-protein) reductase FabG [Planctomycetes bacterium ADurb.Bin412]|nr:MAG: 3-oxoacyl-(acyl-carrier-protein) reductase FabG [Planctomycetes bacterium ADurb.Bin412]
MKVDLNGKVALVTGAARNIGKAIADVFAANGAKVVYADVDYEVAKESASRYPGCKAMKMDVSNETEVNEVIDKIVKDFGTLDILVNNAGVNTAKHRVTIEEFPRHEWDRLISIDLTGLYLVSKAGVKPMLKQGSGKIINITSVLGLVPARLQCAFIAAKAGVVNLTKAMALELGSRGVLVNCIAPGSILTEGTKSLFYGNDGMFSEKVQQMLAHIPLGRPGESEEIAHAALFLAAPESSYINGHILTVDGGWTAGYIREF